MDGRSESPVDRRSPSAPSHDHMISFAGFVWRFGRPVPSASGQSDALRPPRQPVRRSFFCRRSYMTSILPQTAFIRRSSGEDMPWISAAAIGRLEARTGTLPVG